MKKTKNYINFKGEYVNVENKTLTEIYNEGKLEGWIAATRKHNELVKNEALRNEPDERPQGEWVQIKTRELTEEEKEEYPDCTFMYDCKLPEDGEEVLVTTWSGIVALDTFYRDEGCYFETYCDEEDVIAWRPLPEPYKKGGTE